MQPSDFEDQLEEILFAALQVSGDERRRLLDERCSDRPDLRAEVDALLAAHDRATPLFDTPTMMLRTPPDIGQRVGAFRLMDVIGEGGMGTVFRAERADGEFTQQVAIKFIGSWTRDPAAVRRFRGERQILASLQHPNIVSLLDGGVTPDGNAYLVMEYVDGEPISAYCRSCRLPLEDRLRLFLSVCAAVQFAHSHLVVHRDLKPANIVVTRDGVSKVLDFGVAKLMEPAVQPSATISGFWPGPLTPNYASPEQLRGVPITTVSDVYSLGVLLYELLAGARPYETSGKPVDEVLSLVIDGEIRPPSTVPSRDENGVPYSRSALIGDLDAIVSRALQKDPSRRYPSAGELADDVDRFLRGRAVSARPDTTVYRVSKFVRRHRFAVAGAMAAVVSLVAGLGMALWQANAARLERDRARLEAAKAQQVSAFLRALFTSNTPLEALGRPMTAQELLDRGVLRIDRELSGQPDVQASMLASLGSVYTEMGLGKQGLPLIERSLALREAVFGGDHLEVAESLYFLGRLKSRAFSDYPAAASLLTRAVAIRDREAGENDAALAPVLSELGMALWHAGKYLEGQSALRRAVALGERTGTADLHKWLANLALLEQDLGDFTAAEALLRRALDLGVKQTGRRGVPVGPTMVNLGTLLRAQERFTEARAVLEELNADEEKTFGQGRMYTWGELGELYFATGEHRRARELLDAAIALGARERATTEPYELSAPLLYLGRLLLAQDQPVEALLRFEHALAIRRRTLGEKHNDVAQALVDLAQAKAALEGPHVSEPLLRQALAIQRDVLVTGHRYLVPTLVALGDAATPPGAMAEAQTVLQEASDIARRSMPEHHSHRLAAEAAVGRLSR
jgi:eukaryotic-like serine/threonine-protein kinase